MAIPKVSGLAAPPSFSDLANFGTNANAFVGSLPNFVASVNAAIDQMNALGLGDVSAFVKTLLDDATASAFYATLGQVPAAQIRDDLPADKAFRQGNVMGAVGMSGGVPSGSVLERGNNANGSYVRFADGTQICWYFFDDNTQAWSTARGSAFFVRAIDVSWTYPATFTNPPIITPQAVFLPDSRVTGAFVSAYSATSAQVRPWTSGATVVSDPKGLSLIAIGRWY